MKDLKLSIVLLLILTLTISCIPPGAITAYAAEMKDPLEEPVGTVMESSEPVGEQISETDSVGEETEPTQEIPTAEEMIPEESIVPVEPVNRVPMLATGTPRDGGSSGSETGDTLKGHNAIAPFKNILNDMYAQDISKKVKNAKHQRAKQGLYIGSDAPYGYIRDPDEGKLVVDSVAAETVKLIFSLAQTGYGSVAIANELRRRQIETPSYYKFKNGKTRYSRFPSVVHDEPYAWGFAAINHILANPVYTGVLTSLKTEVISCKTKVRVQVPEDQQIVIPNAHEAIIPQEQFEEVAALRAEIGCRALKKRFNLFRGKLFCECCGHPLSISKKKLLSGLTDIYLCMHHYHRPDVCPETHRIYHDMLYPYVLQQVKSFAASMKRRKVNSHLSNYADIEELTPEILDNVIERIEISHVNRKSKPGSVIHIYWKLQ